MMREPDGSVAKRVADLLPGRGVPFRERESHRVVRHGPEIPTGDVRARDVAKRRIAPRP